MAVEGSPQEPAVNRAGQSAPPTRVWLLGPMAVGKSTVGRLVAAELGWPYLDNDEALATTTGRVLADWAPGDVLHQAERAVLRAELERQAPFIAGVAASAADDPDLLAALAATGLIVLLTALPAVLVARAAGTGRPLGDDALATFAAHWADRDRQARAVSELVLDTSVRSAAAIAGELSAWIRRRPRDD